MRESDFQKKLIREIKERLPGAMVLKNDACYKQGLPDLTVFYKGRYAWLEVKRSENADRRPNQEYYISKGKNDGAFSSFIYPENKEEILNELERALKT